MSNRWVAEAVRMSSNPVEQTLTGSGTNLMACPGFGLPHPESWQAIYRLAYEQARAALAPSRFQRSLEPSMN